MNKQQNITKKQKDAHIRELELENSLLKQKIAMIGNIIGMNKPKEEIRELVADEVVGAEVQNSKKNHG